VRPDVILLKMQATFSPSGEAERLAALRALQILDTPDDERFDRVTRLLAHLLETPIALLSLVDAERQWFKSSVGLTVTETPRQHSFCAHAILSPETFVIADATCDQRFRDNPLVVSDPHIRFYAGHPLRGPGGHHVGTLCVIDDKPRELTDRHRRILQDLAAIVERELNLTELGTLQQQAMEAQAAYERLLHRILPTPIAKQLCAGTQMVAEHFRASTVLFVDIEDFSSLAANLPAEQLVEWLNSVFSACDQLANYYGLEKIKSIGDAYMAVAGVPTPRADHAAVAANMALRIQREVLTMTRPDGKPLRVRAGIHSGPVTAGVIGTLRFAYDLWGETVNIAAQLQTTAAPGTILVSTAVQAQLKENYVFEQCGPLALKGGGQIATYVLTARCDR
jgi:adenylate cyclase